MSGDIGRSIGRSIARSIGRSIGDDGGSVLTYALDTFTESSPPVDILSHTLDSGQTWTAAGSEFFRCIGGGKIEDEFDSGAGAITVNAGVASCVIRLTVDQAISRLVARLTTFDNRFVFAIDNSAQISIDRVVADVPTQIAVQGGLTIVFPAQLVVTLDGDDLQFEVVGHAIITATDAFNNTVTHHGIGRLGTAGTADNFSIKSV